MPRGMLRAAALLLLIGTVPVAWARNGYVLSFTGKHQLAGTRELAFNSSNPEIAKLQEGFTLMLWAKFHDITTNAFQPTIQLGLSTDGVRATHNCGRHAQCPPPSLSPSLSPAMKKPLWP